MYFKTLLLTLLLFSNYLTGQLQMPSSSLGDWSAIERISENMGQIKESDLLGLPVYRLRDGYFVSLYGKAKPNADFSELSTYGVIVGSRVGDIQTLKVPLSNFSSIGYDLYYSYIELPGRVAPDLHKVIVDVRADSVQQGINLPEAFTGKDVIIGITDWGFDYTHPMFYDTLLQETRILAAWDQYKMVGQQPTEFAYGAEYNSVDELLNAQSDTANIYSYHTHGNHVAGIAGGGGAGSEYRGMAPESEFLFTTFLVDAASVLDAFTWMKQIADEQEKRLVVNMSWGLYYIGTLDGTSLLSQAIDVLSDEGVVFVSSGGNNGDNNFHISKTFDNDSFSSRIAFDSYANPNMWGQSISMWGEANNPFDIRVQVYSGANVLLSETPLYSTDDGQFYLDSSLVFNNDTVWYNLAVESAHPLNTRPHVRLRVKNTNTSYKVVLQASAQTGTVHFWNVVELINGVGNWGLSFISFGDDGISGDAQNSIGEPACTNSVIAVAAYNSGYLSSGGDWLGGQLAGFSSIGPLITGQMKPDIAAPGVNVVSSISSYTDANYTTTASIIFEGQEYDFAKFSGTSMSSPCVAGIVALLLDANPELTADEVKEILQTSAREDEETGEINPPGDTRWGYGKVHAYNAIVAALQYANIGSLNIIGDEMTAYPNPFADELQIRTTRDEQVLEIKLFSVEGQLIQRENNSSYLDCTNLSKGIYIVEVRTTKGRYRSKVLRS